MEKESTLEDLQKLLLKYSGCILYTPLENEVDYSSSKFPLKIPENALIIPKDKNSNPFEWADNCITKFKNTDVFILIPGTQFDIYGTRHGRGAGWYDRFLSKIPRTWLRIGITHNSNFSNSKLTKQKWDESVDWVLIQNDTSWSIYKILNNI